MRYLVIGICVCLASCVVDSKPDSPRRVYLKRCRLGEPCYPTSSSICELRKSLTGRVILPSDVDYRNVVLMLNRRITNYPGIVVEAMSTKDVQKALKFARKYNLEVAVKYDAFDPIGRSSNDGGIVIDMSAWKGQSSVVSSVRNTAGEVTLNAGNTWGETYAYVDTITTTQTDGSILRRIISGSMYNEESVGRFTQGGGVGPLSRSLGMAVDNLLEATLVTVSGKVVKVSSAGVYYLKESGWSLEYKNTDLFYAIRGGGAGTFGVVLTLTFKLHFAPANLNQFTFSHLLHQNGQFVGRDALRQLLIDVKNLDNVFGVDVVSLSGNRDVTSREGEISWQILQNFDVNSQFSGTGSDLFNYNATGTLLPGGSVTPRPTYLNFANSIPALTSGNGYFFNTFIQPEVVDDPEKLDKLVDIFLSVVNKPTVDSSVGCIGTLLGGAISSVPAFSTPVNPLLRSGFMLLSCGVVWPENGDCDGETFKEAASDMMDKMEDIGGGVFFNNANEDLKNWKTAVFGRHYRKLVDVKRMWDADNFLYCENCVGSDFRFDCFEKPKYDGMQLSSYLYYSSCGYMFGN